VIAAGAAGVPARLAARGPGTYASAALGAAAAIVAALAAVALGPTALLVPVALIGAGLLLRYPPVLLAAFVFVPFFESAPVIGSIPGDPTVMLGALLVGVYARRVAARSVSAIPAGLVIPFLLIGAALAVGLIGTPAPDYGAEKVLKYFTVTLVAAVAPFFVVRTRAELMQFLGAIVAGAIVIAAVTPMLKSTVIPGITYELDTQGRYSFGGQIFPARFLCTAALVLISAPAFVRGRVRFLGPLVAVGVLFVALGFGARGPIVAFVAALAGVVLLSGLRAPRQLVLVLLAVTAAGMVLPFVSLPGQSASRLAEVASDPTGVLRGDTRSALYDEALRLTREHPLTGIGTGGFSIYTSVVTPPKFKLNYPHNIFLELSTEVGVVPAVVLVLPIVAGMGLLLRRVRVTTDRSERHIAILVLGLFLLNFFATQFSGDINDNRTLWLFLALAWLIGRDGVRSRGSSPATAS
jgi:O-antigen ligase